MLITLKYNLKTNSLRVIESEEDQKEYLISWFDYNYFRLFFSINEFVNNLCNLDTAIDKYLKITVKFSEEGYHSFHYITLLNEYNDPFFLNLDKEFQTIFKKNIHS